MEDGVLAAALKAKRATGRAGGASARLLAAGEGWMLYDVVCSAGPDDRSFEERHTHASVSFVLAGSFAYRAAHGRSLLTPGAILLGRGGACFECGHRHGEGDRCLSFHFEPGFLDELARAASGVVPFDRPSLPPDRRLSPLFARLMAQGADQACDELALDVLTTVLGHTQASLAARRDTLADEARVSQAVRYIEAHYTERITLSDLARRARLSRFAFLRLYRAVTGTTPHQHLLRLRLRAAAKRLATTKTPVTEVAYAVGFEDLSHFTRSFRSEFGFAPSGLRRTRGG